MGAIRSLSRRAAFAGAVVAGGALAVTASSILATPQPLESALEGDSQIFRFRGGDIFYKVRGPQGAQPVLLLHGIHLGSSSFEWRKNFHALGQSFRVYAPDLPGFGLSDRSVIEYNADLYINLISDFAREVIARPSMVVARGQSAAFATRAAYLDEQLFSRLVFISPSGIVPTPSAERQELRALPIGALRGVLGRIGESFVGQVPYAFLTLKPALSLLIARQSYVNPEYATPDVVQNLFATTHQFGARYAPLAFMSGKLDADVASNFAALHQPVLLVWGEQDAINEALNAENLHRLNPQTRLELIRQAGNAVQDEQADEVNELLRAWFLAPPELVAPARKTQATQIAEAAPAAQSAKPETAAPAAQETTPEIAALPAVPEAAAPPAQVIPPAPRAAAPAASAEPAEGNGKTPGTPVTHAEASSYVEAPSDESVPLATPPAASPAAPPEPFATADVQMPSVTPGEATTTLGAAQPAEAATPAPATARAVTSDIFAQTEEQAATEMLAHLSTTPPVETAPMLEPEAPAAGGAPETAPQTTQVPGARAFTPAGIAAASAPPSPEDEPAASALHAPPQETAATSAPSSLPPQPPASGAQRRPPPRPSAQRPARGGKPGQTAPQREGTRQARPDAGGKQPPRPSGGSKKRK